MIYGYIYKLFCLDTREMYIGSTINMKKRINRHNEKKDKHISSSKQIINRNNYIFLILQEGFYINKDHLRAIEDYYICKLPCINSCRAFITINEYHKNRRIDNREFVLNYEKIYRQNNKENICKIQKKYIEFNKEKIKDKQQEYREKNKQKINEKQNEKKSCEFCGKLGNRNSKSRHLKTCKKNPNNLISQVSV